MVLFVCVIGIDIPNIEDLIGFGHMKAMNFEIKPFYKREEDDSGLSVKGIYGFMSASVSNLKASMTQQRQMMTRIEDRKRAMEESGNRVLADSEDDSLPTKKHNIATGGYFLGISNYWSQSEDCLNILVPFCGASIDMLELSNTMQKYIAQLSNSDAYYGNSEEESESEYESEHYTTGDIGDENEIEEKGDNNSKKIKKKRKRKIKDYRIIGIDCSERAIDYFIKKNNLACEHHSFNYHDKRRLEVYYFRIYKIEILRSNLFDSNVIEYIQPNSIDVIYDCNSFICVNPSERIEYCSVMSKLLRKENCNILMNTVNYSNYYSHSFPYSVNDSDIIRYFGDWCENILLVNQRLVTFDHTISKSKNDRKRSIISKNNKFFNNSVPKQLATFLRKNIPSDYDAIEEMWLIRVR